MLEVKILEECLDLILPKKTNNTDCESNRLASCIKKFYSTLGDGYQFSIPAFFVLKLTSSCNLRCKHCFYSGETEYYNRQNELSTQEWINFIDYLGDEINPLGIAITGGEILLRKDVIEIIEHIKTKRVPLSIQTNATLVTEEIADKLSKILYYKTDGISISLDGADKASHDFIRGNGSFDKTVSAIRILRKYDIPISVNLTLTTVSAPNITKIFGLCKELGVNYISINKFKVCNEKHAYLKLDEIKSIEYTNAIIKEYKKYPEINAKIKTLNIFDFIALEEGRNLLDKHLVTDEFKEIRCYSCHNHSRATISSTGDVFLCSMDESSDAVIGNIREQDFIDIWENRFSSPYFQPRNFKTLKCSDCKYMGLCGAGCMASAYQKYGDINMPPAECTYFQTMKGEKC